MEDDQRELSNKNESINRYSLTNTCLWLLGFYAITFMLAIMFGIYAQINGTIADVSTWISDGDVTSVFAIFMAISVSIVLFSAIEKEENPLEYIGISKDFSFNGFKPWLILITVYIAFWWVINTAFNIEAPDSMVTLVETTDYVWLSFLAICIVAPIFEEAIFRGFLITRLRYSVLGKSGAVVMSCILFTLLHTQYSGVILFELFTLSLLLATVRIKTNNLQYCVLVHAINNIFSFILMFAIV